MEGGNGYPPRLRELSLHRAQSFDLTDRHQAGVSSAVLTAFNVESYQLLRPDPSDATLAALKLISAQLNGYTLSPPFLNATYVTESGNLTQAPFQAPGSAVWMNVLWFCSLVSSVASALLVLFIKQ